MRWNEYMLQMVHRSKSFTWYPLVPSSCSQLRRGLAAWHFAWKSISWFPVVPHGLAKAWEETTFAILLLSHCISLHTPVAPASRFDRSIGESCPQDGEDQNGHSKSLRVTAASRPFHRSKGGSTSWHHTYLAESELNTVFHSRVFLHLKLTIVWESLRLQMAGRGYSWALSSTVSCFTMKSWHTRIFHSNRVESTQRHTNTLTSTSPDDSWLLSDSHQHCIHIQGHHLPEDWVWELSKAIKTFSGEVMSHLLVPEFKVEAFRF